MNKLGLSSVVATVLLLLLTVAAMATLSGIVIPFVKERLYGSTDCAKYEDSFSFVEEINGANYNCYNAMNNYHAVSLKAKSSINESDPNLAGFQLSFQTNTGSKQYDITRSTPTDGTNSWVLGQKGTPYYLSAGETVSYGFALDKPYSKAEVRSILANGKICKPSDSIKIIKCSPTINING